jgi:cell division protease FtsH
MVTRWGMSERIGMVQLAPRENPYLAGPEGYGYGSKPFSEQTAEAIDSEVRKIIGDSHAQARRLLTEHRKSLDALAQALLEKETLNEEEILAVTGLPRAPALRRDGGARRRGGVTAACMTDAVRRAGSQLAGGSTP